MSVRFKFDKPEFKSLLESYEKDFDMVFTASLLNALQNRDGKKKKPADSLVVILSKALN